MSEEKHDFKKTYEIKKAMVNRRLERTSAYAMGEGVVLVYDSAIDDEANIENMIYDLYRKQRNLELENQYLKNKIHKLGLQMTEHHHSHQLFEEKRHNIELIKEEFDLFDEFGINDLTNEELIEALKSPPKRPDVPTIFDEED